MSLKEFTLGASHTINLGSYESFKFEASVTKTVSVEAQDDPRQWPEKWKKLREEAFDELLTLQRENYAKQLEVKRQIDKKRLGNGNAKGP